MQANEYIRQVGWAKAQSNYNCCKHQYYFTHNGSDICVKDLGCLIQSYERIQAIGGLEIANKIIADAYVDSNHTIPFEHEQLSMDIQNVESCLSEAESSQERHARVIGHPRLGWKKSINHDACLDRKFEKVLGALALIVAIVFIVCLIIIARDTQC